MTTLSKEHTAAVVVADFYKDISDALLAACQDVLTAADLHCEAHTVPGALEIPPAIARLARRRYHCYVALGCVIRGETYHFEVVAHTSAAGLMQAQLQHDIAIGNGILTVDNRAQAMARVGRGASAAAAALALASVGAPHAEDAS